MGTPDFAAPFLKALAEDDGFEVLGVATQADKAVGRKHDITFLPVKKLAIELGLPVFQPEKIAELESKIKNLRPDLAVVAAYGQIIPQSILNIPKYGFINIHASLLPKYRGAAPIQAAILNGDLETGVSIMKMEAGLDIGPVLGQNIVKVRATDTALSLFNKLTDCGLEIFIPLLKKYIKGEIKPIAQDGREATYARTLKKSDAEIDWQKSAEEIERMVRAYNPWPGCHSELRIKNYELRIKIIKVAHNPALINKHQPGYFFSYSGELAVQCGKDALIIKKIQPAGKKPMTGNEFINGYGNKLKIANWQS